MAVLEDIDPDEPMDLTPMRQDLDAPMLRPVDLPGITLAGWDVRRFLGWANVSKWRRWIEEDLQCVANDGAGRELLSTWLPLVTFRESFCAGGRQLQDPGTQAMMERLRGMTRCWRDAGADMVAIDWRRRE